MTSNKTRCFEKCQGTGIVQSTGEHYDACSNPSCECHNTTMTAGGEPGPIGYTGKESSKPPLTNQHLKDAEHDFKLAWEAWESDKPVNMEVAWQFCKELLTRTNLTNQDTKEKIFKCPCGNFEYKGTAFKAVFNPTNQDWELPDWVKSLIASERSRIRKLVEEEIENQEWTYYPDGAREPKNILLHSTLTSVLEALKEDI